MMFVLLSFIKIGRASCKVKVEIPVIARSLENKVVAGTLNKAGLATLLFDLLTPEEESVDLYTREHGFDISLLAERLVHATKWTKQQKKISDLRIGYFGSSTGGGAALVAAAE